MKKWLQNLAGATFATLLVALQVVSANDKSTQDDRDKLGMSSITVPGKAHRLTTSLQITTVVEPKTKPITTSCDAELDMTYYQKDSIAEVSTTIKSSTCTDHAGRFLIRLLYKSEQGETQRIEHQARWSSKEEGDRITEHFPLGENSELLRVNTTIIQCECAALTTEAE